MLTYADVCGEHACLRRLSLAGNELQCVPVSAAALAALTLYDGPACVCEDASCLSNDPDMQAMLTSTKVLALLVQKYEY